MIKKMASIVLALTLSIGMLTACGDNKNNKGDSSAVSDDSSISSDFAANLITINDVPISNGLYKYFFLSSKKDADKGDDSYWTEENKSQLQSIKDNAVYMCKLYYFPRIMAEKYNLKLSEDELKKIDDAIAAKKGEYKSDEEFQKALSDEFLDLETYKEVLTVTELEDKIYKKLYGDGGEYAVSDATIKTAMKDKYVAVKHILILSASDGTDSSVADPLALAKEVQKKAKSGENFEALILQYGKDPGMTQNPDGYFFTNGDMVPAFEKASFALKDNEISDLVTTDYGYHIIKRIPYDTYYKAQSATVKEKYYASLYDALITQELGKMNVVFSDDYNNISLDSFK